jgi:hypothetical protein
MKPSKNPTEADQQDRQIRYHTNRTAAGTIGGKSGREKPGPPGLGCIDRG